MTPNPHRMTDWDLDVALEIAIDQAYVDDYDSLCRLVALAREKAYRLARAQREAA